MVPPSDPEKRMTAHDPIAIAANATLQAVGPPHPHRHPLGRTGKIILQTLYRLSSGKLGLKTLQRFSTMTSSRNIKCTSQHFPIVDCHTSTNPEQCQPAGHATGLHLYFITPALQQAQGIVTYANSANYRHEGLVISAARHAHHVSNTNSCVLHQHTA